MTTATQPVDNGVNSAALLAARDALREAPAAAEFTWRVTSEWVDGTYSRQTIEHFDGLGDAHSHKQAFVLEGDHPEVFASEDRAPTPVETVLAALAGCLTAGVAAVAQNRGIQLRSVKATVEGEHNILGILGGDPRSGTASTMSRCTSTSTPTRRPRRSRRWWPSRRSARPCSTRSPTRRPSPSPSADAGL